jgi:hypothetical protein
MASDVKKYKGRGDGGRALHMKTKRYREQRKGAKE